MLQCVKQSSGPCAGAGAAVLTNLGSLSNLRQSDNVARQRQLGKAVALPPRAALVAGLPPVGQHDIPLGLPLAPPAPVVPDVGLQGSPVVLRLLALQLGGVALPLRAQHSPGHPLAVCGRHASALGPTSTLACSSWACFRSSSTATRSLRNGQRPLMRRRSGGWACRGGALLARLRLNRVPHPAFGQVDHLDRARSAARQDGCTAHQLLHTWPHLVPPAGRGKHRQGQLRLALACQAAVQLAAVHLRAARA